MQYPQVEVQWQRTKYNYHLLIYRFEHETFVVPNSPILPMLGGSQLPIWISILGHNNPILNLNPKTQAKKILTIYNTSNGKIALRKHVIVNHFIVLKKLKKKLIIL